MKYVKRNMEDLTRNMQYSGVFEFVYVYVNEYVHVYAYVYAFVHVLFMCMQS